MKNKSYYEIREALKEYDTVLVYGGVYAGKSYAVQQVLNDITNEDRVKVNALNYKNIAVVYTDCKIRHQFTVEKKNGSIIENFNKITNPDYILIDNLEEYSEKRYLEYIGGSKCKQILVCRAGSTSSWIYRRFFNNENVKTLGYSYKDNEAFDNNILNKDWIEI